MRTNPITACVVALLLLAGCQSALRGTGDLGLVIERAALAHNDTASICRCLKWIERAGL